MINWNYIIIVDSSNKKANRKLMDLLHNCGINFLTGYYEDDNVLPHSKGCFWYALIRELRCGDLDLGYFIDGYYKAMSVDGHRFECNCNDTDLPMIEDVWEKINDKESIFYMYD